MTSTTTYRVCSRCGRTTSVLLTSPNGSFRCAACYYHPATAPAGEYTNAPAVYSLPLPQPDVFDRLAALLKYNQLSDAEKSFLGRLAAEPRDADVILVFADWLEEHGKETQAARMRETAKKK